MVDVKLTARHILGVAILGVVVMMWVASSFLMRSIFGEDKSYDKPFLVSSSTVHPFCVCARKLTHVVKGHMDQYRDFLAILDTLDHSKCSIETVIETCTGSWDVHSRCDQCQVRQRFQVRSFRHRSIGGIRVNRT